MTHLLNKLRRSLMLGVFAGGGHLACQATPNAPPVLGQVPEFQLRDQTGQDVTPETFQGRPWVAAFMFTRCPTVCPKITATMKGLQERAVSEGIELNWASFSVDPENDTPDVLSAYARDKQLNLSNWRFLTGDVEAMKVTAEEGFKIAFDGKPDEKAPHYGITHGSHLVLIDATSRIRGYYRTLDETAQKELLAAVKTLE